MKEFSKRSELLAWVDAQSYPGEPLKSLYWGHQYHSLAHGFLPCRCEQCTKIIKDLGPALND